LKHLWRYVFFQIQRNNQPFGSAANAASHMAMRNRGMPARQDEIFQCWQMCFHRIYLILKQLYIGRCNGRDGQIFRWVGGEIGTEVEKPILYFKQKLPNMEVSSAVPDEAEVRIQLVHSAVAFDAEVAFG